MGFIRMSPALVTTVTARFLMLTAADTSPGTTANKISSRGLLNLVNSTSSSGLVAGRLAIMRGDVPTNFTSLTSYNARSADALVVFDNNQNTAPNGVNNFQGTQESTNPMVITTIYNSAIGAGTATWFWWFTSDVNFGTYNNAGPIYNQIIGTVGITGSGADLTIPTVDLNIGDPCRITNYRLQIPASWDF